VKFIYNCSNGRYSSVIAASLHLGLIPLNEIPDYGKILKLPLLGRSNDTEIGKLEYYGEDSRGNRVYILGRKKSEKIIVNALKGIYQIFGQNPDDLIFINTQRFSNIFIYLGGFLIEHLGLQYVGRSVLLFGIRRSYFKMCNLVERVKKMNGDKK
jgi:hypothetical protein